MSNTRLLLLNRLCLDDNPLVLLKNGTGGGAPALFETAPYKMSNLLLGDRYTLWETASMTFATSVNIDFDIQASVSLDTFAMLGARRASLGAMPSVNVYYLNAPYNPVGGWQFVGTLGNFAASGARDDVITQTPTVAQCVRFQLQPGASATFFTLGKFFAGLSTDLGGIHSPGGTKTPLLNRLDTPLPNGAIVTSMLGDPGAIFTLPWRAASATVRNSWLAAQAKLNSFSFMDWEDHIYEVIMRDARLTEAKGFSNSWDLDITLLRLP